MGVLSLDRKSTRLNSSHGSISYAVFCLKKKTIAPKATTNQPMEHVPNPFYDIRSDSGNAPLLAEAQDSRGTNNANMTSPFFFFNERAPTEIYPLPPHAALPI